MKTRLLITLGLLLIIAIPALGATPAAPAGDLDPGSLAIYYGWPSLVNDANGDLDAAAAVFGQYDVVILSQGIEEPNHGDHFNAKEIIHLLHEGYDTKVYGYMDGPQWGTSWSVTDYPPTNWEGHVDLWKAIGADGIFVDEFGYDWGVTRAQQNAMLDVIHARDLPAFVNSWFIDHTFGSQPDPIFPNGNPGSIPPKIEATDLYMLESFTIIEGNYDECFRDFFDTWITKADKAVDYREQFGTEMWTMTTADALVAKAMAEDDVEERLSYAWHATAMYGLDGFGWTEPQFSASGEAMNQLPWRERPEPNAPIGTGSSFQNDVQHDNTLHTRDTDLGQFQVVCSDTPAVHTATFLVSPTPTPTNTPTETPTATPTPTPLACELDPYDFNGDGTIDIVDIAMVSSRWNTDSEDPDWDPQFDVAPSPDGDGVIDIADISAVAVRFGQSCPED